jgi:hypothetical protein
VISRDDIFTIFPDQVEAFTGIPRMVVFIARSAESGDIPQANDLIAAQALYLIQSQLQIHHILVNIGDKGNFHEQRLYLLNIQKESGMGSGRCCLIS